MVERRRVWHDNTAHGLHGRLDDVARGMTSPPLESTHGRQRQAWHAITVLGQHTWSDDVGHDMPSMPLANTHSRTTSSVASSHRLWATHTVIPSGMACHHRLWAARMVRRRRARHDITTLGQHTRSNDVRHGMTSLLFDNTRSDYVGHGITSLPFDITHGRTTSGVACPYCLWAAHTVELRWAWHAIIALVQ